MKKNGNKMVVIAMLAVMLIVGIFLNTRGSAKEVEEPVIEAKAELVTVWMTESNGCGWGDSLVRIQRAFQEDYEEVELVDCQWNSDRNRMETSWETEYGIVTGHIYDRR